MQEKINQLMQQLKDKQAEVDKLNNKLGDMKHNQDIYIPERSCQIDNDLAEYINNYPER